MGQRAGQVQLRAVDGEDPVPVPQLASRLARGLLENRPVDTPEHVGVNLGAGRADRRGRHRLRLWQRDPQPAALLPQLGQGQGIALAVGREHQPEDEQHHQQGVEDPLPLLPLPVVLARHAHHRADDALPQLHEAILGLRLRHQLARLGQRAWPGRRARPVQQDRAPVGVQRVDVHALGCLGRCRSPGLAPLRHAEELPVGRPVAGRPVVLQVNEGLHQHRPVAVPLLPVLRQLLQRQPQRLRRQELDLLLFFSLFQWILPNYSMNSSGRCSNWFTTAGEN